LYAALPPDAQMNAFRPKPDGCVRKIILSTNIAGEMPLGSNIYVSANLCH
jgi:hypothetical protein